MTRLLVGAVLSVVTHGTVVFALVALPRGDTTAPALHVVLVAAPGSASAADQAEGLRRSRGLPKVASRGARPEGVGNRVSAVKVPSALESASPTPPNGTDAFPAMPEQNHEVDTAHSGSRLVTPRADVTSPDPVVREVADERAGPEHGIVSQSGVAASVPEAARVANGPASVVAGGGGSGIAAARSPAGGMSGSGRGSFGDGRANDVEGASIANRSTAGSAPPRYDNARKPAYPSRARERGEQGAVSIMVRVSKTGHVREARIAESSGSALLDDAAIDAIKQWTFHPARRAGQPIEMWVRVPIRFRLED